MKFTRKSLLPFIQAAIMLLTSTTPAVAWTAFVQTKLLPNYLNRQGSLLTQITKSTIKVTDSDVANSSNSAPYRDLYYSKSQPIGCIQHNALKVTHGTRGKIIVSSASSSMTAQEATVLTNSIERLYLDFYLLDCHVRDVVVPSESFNLLVDGLLQNNFYNLPTEGSGQAMDTLVLLHIEASSGNQAVYLMWQPPHR